MAFVRLSETTWMVGHGRSRRLSEPTSRCFYAPDFFLKDPAPWIEFEHFDRWTDARWRNAFASVPVTLPFQPPARLEFLERTRDLLEDIRDDRLKKAVPVVFETHDGMFDPRHVLGKVADAPGFPYGVILGSEAMVGATPEILFRLDGMTLETMALAGTATLDAPNLLENAKERHEHQLVIEDLCKQLESFGRVAIGKTREKILPHLKHLMTPVKVKLFRSTSPLNLVKALHPTPALGGSPREEAFRWLQCQPEADSRGRFGAPFGFVEGGNALVLVAIRNVQVIGQQTVLGSGCGIVEGSRPESEWNELTLKRKSVKSLLGIS